jgi:hypothetical protein
VAFEERRLEDLRRLNRLERRDEKPFEAVAAVSELSERAYSLFVRPVLRPLMNEGLAEWRRAFHPLRWQRWAVSDLNPLLWPLPALASVAKATRQAAPPENPYRRAENALSEALTAGLDLYRDLRDATMEALFFQIYGGLTAAGVVDGSGSAPPAVTDPRELPLVQDALAAIGKGGYPEAVALIGALVGRGAGRIPLARLELVDRIIQSDESLSQLPADTMRRIKAEQAVIAELEPERGLQALPKLLADPDDRRRVLDLLDEATAAIPPTAAQQEVVQRVRSILGGEATPPRLMKFSGASPAPAAAT